MANSSSNSSDDERKWQKKSNSNARVEERRKRVFGKKWDFGRNNCMLRYAVVLSFFPALCAILSPGIWLIYETFRAVRCIYVINYTMIYGNWMKCWANHIFYSDSDFSPLPSRSLRSAIATTADDSGIFNHTIFFCSSDGREERMRRLMNSIVGVWVQFVIWITRQVSLSQLPQHKLHI